MAITFGQSYFSPTADPAYQYVGPDESGNPGYWINSEQYNQPGGAFTAQRSDTQPMQAAPDNWGLLGTNKNLADLLTSKAAQAGVTDYDFGPALQQLSNSSALGGKNDNWYLQSNPVDAVQSILKATGDPRFANVGFTPQEQAWANGVTQDEQGQFKASRDTGLRPLDYAVLAAIAAGGGAALAAGGAGAGLGAAGEGAGAGTTGLADEFLGQSYAGLGSYGAGAASGAGASEGLDAIGQMVTQIPDGMTATSYAASQGFPSADAWLSSLGGGAGAAAGASTTGLSGSAPADVAAGTGPGADTAYGTLGGGADASTAYGTLGAAGAGTAASGGSALSNLLSGTAGGSDILKLLGQVAPGLIDAYGSSQKADSLSDLANQFAAYGAPSRARYEASMTPGFDPYTSIAGYKGAVDTSSESLLRQLSATGGNPYGNPGGLIEAQKSVINGTALPAVQEYQRLNAGAGGLANLAAAYPGAATSAAGASSGVYTGLGDALGNALAPKQLSLSDLLKQFGGSQTGLA